MLLKSAITVINCKLHLFDECNQPKRRDVVFTSPNELFIHIIYCQSGQCYCNGVEWHVASRTANVDAKIGHHTERHK